MTASLSTQTHRGGHPTHTRRGARYRPVPAGPDREPGASAGTGAATAGHQHAYLSRLEWCPDRDGLDGQPVQVPGILLQALAHARTPCAARDAAARAGAVAGRRGLDDVDVTSVRRQRVSAVPVRPTGGRLVA